MKNDTEDRIIASTKRLRIRELRLSDLDALYELYTSCEEEPDVEPLSADRDEEYVKLHAYIDYMYGFYGVGLWAVCEKQTGRLIGRCGV